MDGITLTREAWREKELDALGGEREEKALRDPCELCGGAVRVIDWKRDYVTVPGHPGREVLADVVVVQCEECGERERR